MVLILKPYTNGVKFLAVPYVEQVLKFWSDLISNVVFRPRSTAGEECSAWILNNMLVNTPRTGDGLSREKFAITGHMYTCHNRAQSTSKPLLNHSTLH